MKKRVSKGGAMPRQSPNVLSDQPWWVRTIVWVGVPTAVAAVLLWFVLGQLTTRLDHLSTSYESHQKDMAAFQSNMAALTKHLQQETEQAWVQLGVMQRICLNTAQSADDRMACVAIAAPPRRAE